MSESLLAPGAYEDVPPYEDEDVPRQVRKPSISEAISCEFFIGAFCLFLAMCLAEALAAIPYCMVSQQAPFYKGGDGYQECLLNYREAAISTPTNCGDDEDGGCYWNSKMFALNLGVVDLSIADTVASRSSITSFSLNVSVAPDGANYGSGPRSILSYGNAAWLKNLPVSGFDMLGWDLWYITNGGTTKGGTFRLVSSVDSTGCSLHAPETDNTMGSYTNLGLSYSDGSVVMNATGEGATGWTTISAPCKMGLGVDGIRTEDNVIEGMLIEGGRGVDHSDLEPTDAQTFQGKIKNVRAEAKNKARYHTIFLLLLLGSLTLCCLRILGQVMVAHWDNIMKEKMNVAQAQQKHFVESQLERSSKVPVTTSWREEVYNWTEAKRLVKERQAQLDREETGQFLICLPRRLALFFGYFCALTFGLWFLMVVTCPRGWGLNVRSDGFLEIFSGAWNFGAAPWGWLFLFSSILETFIFVMACLRITWPDKPDALPRPEQELRTAPIPATGGNGRACLLIACHNSSIDADAQADISRTIRAALVNFPPEAIFVCDNGNGVHPSDNTEGFVQGICEEIFPGRRLHYVYIPEGNKTHSLYWTTELWIPSLHQRGACPDFEYLVMIDDDVPLPPNFDFQSNKKCASGF